MTQRIALLTGRGIDFEICRQTAQLDQGAPGAVVQGADTVGRLTTLPDGGPQGGYFRNRQPMAW